jgi:hypothetical protein
MSESKPVAQAKAQRALDYIEAAQRLLGSAAEELCPIAGLCPEWEAVGKQYDKVHALWHRVNMRANGNDYDLDSDTKRRLAAKAGNDKPEPPEAA